jgi:hypothetical protein
MIFRLLLLLSLFFSLNFLVEREKLIKMTIGIHYYKNTNKYLFTHYTWKDFVFVFLFVSFDSREKKQTHGNQKAKNID